MQSLILLIKQLVNSKLQTKDGWKLAVPCMKLQFFLQHDR